MEASQLTAVCMYVCMYVCIHREDGKDGIRHTEREGGARVMSEGVKPGYDLPLNKLKAMGFSQTKDANLLLLIFRCHYNSYRLWSIGWVR